MSSTNILNQMRTERYSVSKKEEVKNDAVKIVYFKVLKIKDPRINRIKEVDNIDFNKTQKFALYPSLIQEKVESVKSNRIKSNQHKRIQSY